MRFLCLHGRGTNSDIFERHLMTICSRISPQHTFDFIDAQFESPAAPGISQLYPPPYLSWHNKYEPENVRLVHDYVTSIIEEDGPYDGVIGFSEGAALAASFLLSRSAFQKDPLFKVAIFFNSVMIISPSEQVGVYMGCEMHQQGEKHKNFMLGLDDKTSSSHSSLDSHSEESGVVGPFPRIFGFPPDRFQGRISIPTLHVIAADDDFEEHARTLVELCDPAKAEVLVIEGGHELPRAEAAQNKCAELIELIIAMASF
ncbi:hypothetical protein AJ80_01316 [Polytolypa hystricis UAMH7299]|uniref:Serine hydrolase domain-containing protein n=1 Tax=Polytolypa hystricis (strain UAMH7299) TaxID=1447883 RepID=A0A2B7YSC8_POLH7|nr:hypothetical protein AJ80_01316 [Polytolypa hystricis UAMH7299]